MLFLKLTRRLKKLFNRQRDWPSNGQYPVVTALGNEVTGAVWQHGVAAEIAFWNQWLATRGGQWPADFSFRTTPTAPLQPHVLAALPSSLGVTVHILDVGAGPLTYLGKQWAGHCLQITAIDPLAAEYDQLLQRYQLTPLVRTQQGFAEHLLDQFGGDRFDLVHARNSIDHSYDPVRAIEQMVAVTKPGGVVYMHHAVNEAQAQRFQGFHQWNLFSQDGDLYVGNATQTINVSQRLKPVAAVENQLFDGGIWMATLIRKQPAA